MKNLKNTSLFSIIAIFFTLIITPYNLKASSDGDTDMEAVSGTRSSPLNNKASLLGAPTPDAVDGAAAAAAASAGLDDTSSRKTVSVSQTHSREPLDLPENASCFVMLPQLATPNEQIVFFKRFMEAFLKNERPTTASISGSWQRDLVNVLVSHTESRGAIESDLIRYVPKAFHNRTFLEVFARIHPVATEAYTRPMKGPLLDFFVLPYLREFQSNWMNLETYPLFERFTCAFLRHNAGALVSLNQNHFLNASSQITGFCSEVLHFYPMVERCLENVLKWSEAQSGERDATPQLETLLRDINALVFNFNPYRGMRMTLLESSVFRNMSPQEVYGKLHEVFSVIIAHHPYQLERTISLLTIIQEEMLLFGFSANQFSPLKTILNLELLRIINYKSAIETINTCFKNLAEGLQTPLTPLRSQRETSSFLSASKAFDAQYELFKKALQGEVTVMDQALSEEAVWRPYVNFLNHNPSVFSFVLGKAIRENTRATSNDTVADDLILSEKQESEIKGLKEQITALKAKLKTAQKKPTAQPPQAPHDRASEEHAQKEKDHLVATLKEREREIQTVRQEIETLRTKHEHFQTLFREKEEAGEKAHREKDQTQSENTQLKSDIEALRKSLKERNRALKKLTKKQSDFQSQSERLASLQAQLDEMRALKETAAERVTILEALAARISLERDRFHQDTMRLRRERDEATSEREDLLERFDTLTRDAYSAPFAIKHIWGREMPSPTIVSQENAATSAAPAPSAEATSSLSLGDADVWPRAVRRAPNAAVRRSRPRTTYGAVGQRPIPSLPVVVPPLLSGIQQPLGVSHTVEQRQIRMPTYTALPLSQAQQALLAHQRSQQMIPAPQDLLVRVPPIEELYPSFPQDHREVYRQIPYDPHAGVAAPSMPRQRRGLAAHVHAPQYIPH